MANTNLTEQTKVVEYPDFSNDLICDEQSTYSPWIVSTYSPWIIVEVESNSDIETGRLIRLGSGMVYAAAYALANHELEQRKDAIGFQIKMDIKEK